MFSQLVASRSVPADDGRRQGLVASAVLHGSILAAALLLTRTLELPSPPQGPRIITLPVPASPSTSTPAPAERAGGAATGVATAAAPSFDVPSIDLPSMDPLRIPTTILDPSAQPWPGGGTGRQVGGSSGQPSGVPMEGAPLSALQVDVPAALRPRSPVPGYPEALRRMRVEGSVRVRFVVDTAGIVERPSVMVLEATHPAFEAAVRSALPRMRFAPARVGARAVRQLVEFPVAFTLAAP